MKRLLPKEHIYETETDSDIDLWLPRGGGWEGMDWEFGISICTSYYIEKG